MPKVHLLRNKNPDTFGKIAACATNPYSAKATRNGRASYQHMDSAIVPIDEFRAVSPEHRCAHCCEAILIIRNRQRKAHGKLPITRWDE